MKMKKAYNKPGIVFQDFETGELTGSPEMIERIKKECAAMEDSHAVQCPFEDMAFPCSLRTESKN